MELLPRALDEGLRVAVFGQALPLLSALFVQGGKNHLVCWLGLVPTSC